MARGVLNLVKLLLDAKVPLDVSNKSGSTPMHMAANNGSVRAAARSGGVGRPIPPQPSSCTPGVLHGARADRRRQA